MTVEKEKLSTCGLIMPISSIDGCDESHWVEVKDILTEAIQLAGFQANLVSNSDDIGVIQKRIIQNLYENPIVVCDVSAKNPNVMFELGLRLAFDKPTIIVKDNKTSYSFDTSAIEHLEYPRDLRFSQIVEFKKSLTRKIQATVKAATSDPNHTTFLKHFGTFTVAKLDQKEVTGNEMVLSEIHELRSAVMSMSRRGARSDIDPQQKVITIEQSTQLFTKIRDAIDEFKKRNGVTKKSQLYEIQETLREYVEQRIEAPKHFNSPGEFNDLFYAVFNMIS